MVYWVEACVVLLTFILINHEVVKKEKKERGKGLVGSVQSLRHAP